MTTWGDVRDLPKWPDLTRVRVEKRVAGFNTIAGTYELTTTPSIVLVLYVQHNHEINCDCHGKSPVIDQL